MGKLGARWQSSPEAARGSGSPRPSCSGRPLHGSPAELTPSHVRQRNRDRPSVPHVREADAFNPRIASREAGHSPFASQTEQLATILTGLSSGHGMENLAESFQETHTRKVSGPLR